VRRAALWRGRLRDGTQYAFRFEDGSAVLWRGDEVLARGRIFGSTLQTTEGTPEERTRLRTAWNDEWGHSV